MARPRSPNRDKAMQLWLDSKKKRQLKDIAAELQVSEEQVRKWKNQDKWDKVTLPKLKSNVTNHRGGQPGNKNATGPPGNKNAVKTGEFETAQGDPIDGMTVVSVKKGLEKGQSTDLKEYQGKLGQIQSIEDALTRVQARRQKAIEMLHKFGYDDVHLELIKAQAERIRSETGSGEEEEKVVIVNDV